MQTALISAMEQVVKDRARIIFVSMYTDISWWQTKNENVYRQNTLRVASFAKDFEPGRWSFFGSGKHKQHAHQANLHENILVAFQGAPNKNHTRSRSWANISSDNRTRTCISNFISMWTAHHGLPVEQFSTVQHRNENQTVVFQKSNFQGPIGIVRNRSVLLMQCLSCEWKLPTDRQTTRVKLSGHATSRYWTTSKLSALSQ